MLQQGQEFKSYRQLCEALGEPIKDGNSKKAQLKSWESMFSYHKIGNKIIIDEVFSDSHPLVRRTSNCHQNMDIYLPYIHHCLAEKLGDHMNSSKVLCDLLEVFNEQTLKAAWDGDTQYFETHGIPVTKKTMFARWFRSARLFSLETFETALRNLQADDMIIYSADYAFLSQPKRTRYMGYVAGFNDEIRQIETDVCNEINKKRNISSKIHGKQLEYILYQKDKTASEYKRLVIGRMMQNPSLVKVLQESVGEKFYGVEMGSEDYPIKDYWKVWSINECVVPKPMDVPKAKSDYLDLIVRKTAKDEDIPQSWRDLAFLT